MSGSFLLNLETAIGAIGNGAASNPVVIGSMTLAGQEVPDYLSVGGEQMLVVTTLPNGVRVIREMGNDPTELTLAGRFVGPAALSRAQQIQAMRVKGALIYFSVANLRMQVAIRSYRYTLTQRAAVIPYEMVLVVFPIPATTSPNDPATLSSYVGPDVANAVSAVSSAAATVSTYAADAVGAAQTVLGQVTPIANMVGAGGALATVTDNLTAASALASAGTNFAAAPAAAASLIQGLSNAGASLSGIISQTGANLAGIQATANPGDIAPNGEALLALQANMAAHLGAVQAGQTVNRAIVNTQLAAGLTPTAAVVHS